MTNHYMVQEKYIINLILIIMFINFLKKRVLNGHPLTKWQQSILFKSSQAPKLLNIYISKRELCDEAQLKLFELPNAKELVKTYIFLHMELCDAAQVKLVELPNPIELIEMYISRRPFCAAAKIKMIEQPNAAQLLKLLHKHQYYLGDTVQLKLFEQPNAVELVKMYTSWYRLCDDAQLKLLDLPDAPELVKMYISKWGLGKKAQFKCWHKLMQQSL